MSYAVIFHSSVIFLLYSTTKSSTTISNTVAVVAAAATAKILLPSPTFVSKITQKVRNEFCDFLVRGCPWPKIGGDPHFFL